MLEKIFKVFSGSKPIEEEFGLVGNCFGFYSVNGNIGTSTMIWEIANQAASKVRVCIVDCNPQSTFYRNKTKMVLLDSSDNSLQKKFIKNSAPLSDILVNVKNNLAILDFGNIDWSHTFNLQENLFEETFKELKETFDLVLMDIPNNIYLESTLAAIIVSSTVFTMYSSDISAIEKEASLLNFYSLSSLQNKFKNIILCMSPEGYSLSDIANNMTGELFGEFAYNSDIKKTSFQREDILTVVKDKAYNNLISKILNRIFNGLASKGVSDNVEP